MNFIKEQLDLLLRYLVFLGLAAVVWLIVCFILNEKVSFQQTMINCAIVEVLIVARKVRKIEGNK